MKLNTKDFEVKMEKALSVLAGNFDTIRAGQANPAVLNRVSFEYYGSLVCRLHRKKSQRPVSAAASRQRAWYTGVRRIKKFYRGCAWKLRGPDFLYGFQIFLRGCFLLPFARRSENKRGNSK